MCPPTAGHLEQYLHLGGKDRGHVGRCIFDPELRLRPGVCTPGYIMSPPFGEGSEAETQGGASEIQGDASESPSLSPGRYSATPGNGDRLRPQSHKKTRKEFCDGFVYPKGQAGAVVDEAVFAERRVGLVSSFSAVATGLGSSRFARLVGWLSVIGEHPALHVRANVAEDRAGDRGLRTGVPSEPDPQGDATETQGGLPWADLLWPFRPRTRCVRNGTSEDCARPAFRR